jgi:serine/threonine-protein kinase
MEPRPGEIFQGKYEILHLVGRGASARVYKARHQHLNRDVAIKFLKIDGPVARKRFEVEAKVISNLRHPTTVRLFDYGVYDEIPYAVLEYVVGRTLRDVIDWRGAFSPDRTAGILLQILGCLKEAHRLGVVHRDLKPSNIILSQPDPARQQDRVKVLDFGMAKLLATNTRITHPGRLTARGTTVGTPRYMSPEQLAGRQIGPATDLFSLGLIGYEMLVGEHPFASINEFRIASKYRESEPIRLPRDVDVDSDFARIIHRLLEKPLEDRYDNALDVIRDLESLGELTQDIPTPFDVEEPTNLAAGDSTVEGRSFVSVLGHDPFEEISQEFDEEDLIPPGIGHVRRPVRVQTQADEPTKEEEMEGAAPSGSSKNNPWPILGGAAVAVLIILLAIAATFLF